MIRRGLILAMLIVFCHGPAVAQGWFDSILGSGGLGLWDSGVAGQWNNSQFYGGSQMPGSQAGGQLYGEQPLQPVPPGAPQQGYAPPQQQYAQPQQGYAPPPQDYSQGSPQASPQVAPSYSQQGIYSDWHASQPTQVGPQAQEQYAQPPQQYAPPQQYGTQQQQYAPQAPQPVRQQPRAQQQRARQRQAATPPPPPVSVQPQYGVPQGPTVQQGHYAPAQRQITADDLPAGAVQVTTTTPDGTQVQYYPPPGMPEQTPAMQPQPRRQQPRSAATRPRAAKPQVREQTAANGEAEVAPSIPMPRPVEIPRGQDPREGWGGGLKRSTGPNR